MQLFQTNDLPQQTTRYTCATPLQCNCAGKWKH